MYFACGYQPVTWKLDSSLQLHRYNGIRPRGLERVKEFQFRGRSFRRLEKAAWPVSRALWGKDCSGKERQERTWRYLYCSESSSHSHPLSTPRKWVPFADVPEQWIFMTSFFLCRRISIKTSWFSLFRTCKSRVLYSSRLPDALISLIHQSIRCKSERFPSVFRSYLRTGEGNLYTQSWRLWHTYPLRR